MSSTSFVECTNDKKSSSIMCVFDETVFALKRLYSRWRAKYD